MHTHTHVRAATHAGVRVTTASGIPTPSDLCAATLAALQPHLPQLPMHQLARLAASLDALGAAPAQEVRARSDARTLPTAAGHVRIAYVSLITRPCAVAWHFAWLDLHGLATCQATQARVHGLVACATLQRRPLCWHAHDGWVLQQALLPAACCLLVPVEPLAALQLALRC